MFSQVERLHTTQDILFCLRQGKRRSFDLVQCSYLPKADKLGRVTVIVDTKVSKKAVMRNLLKRRARAILRTIGLPHGDLVIRLRPGTDKLEFQELERQIKSCLIPLIPR